MIAKIIGEVIRGVKAKTGKIGVMPFISEPHLEQTIENKRAQVFMYPRVSGKSLKCLSTLVCRVFLPGEINEVRLLQGFVTGALLAYTSTCLRLPLFQNEEVKRGRCGGVFLFLARLPDKSVVY